jgi:hypothetical protein
MHIIRHIIRLTHLEDGLLELAEVEGAHAAGHAHGGERPEQLRQQVVVLQQQRPHRLSRGGTFGEHSSARSGEHPSVGGLMYL